MQILHPPCQHTGLDPNNASLVLRLSYGSIDVLFTAGEIEAEGESVLLSAQREIASEIVKVPHHGEPHVEQLGSVQSTASLVAVASLGFQNRFHFPAPEVVRRYERHGGAFLRTDTQGAIILLSDGRGYQVIPFFPFLGGAKEMIGGDSLGK